MKPKNFPARRLIRQGASPQVIAQARSIRTKKTPKSTWTAARIAARGGKMGRHG